MTATATLEAVSAPEICDLLDGPAVQSNQAVRLELIVRIRRMIDAGTYDNDQRLQAALDRLLDGMM